MNFKITGKAEGKHTIEMEDGGRLHIDDKGLSDLKKEHKLLGTNDEWPNRPKAEPYESPAKGEKVDLKPIFKQLEEMGKANEALTKRVEALEAKK